MAIAPELLDSMRAAASLPAGEFVRTRLFAYPPFAFREEATGYDQFREELAELLALEVTDISMVGSGRLGYSLKPENLLRPFGSDSDLDMALIASDKFDRSWIELLRRQSEFALAGEEDVRRLKRTRQNFF